MKKHVSSRSLAAVTAAAVGVSAFVVPNAMATNTQPGATIGGATIGGANTNGESEGEADKSEEMPDIVKASTITSASKISTPGSEDKSSEASEPAEEGSEAPSAPSESDKPSEPEAPVSNEGVALKDEDLEYKTFDSLHGVEFAVQSRPISDMGDQIGEDGTVSKVTWYRVDYRNMTDEVARGAKLYHTISGDALVSNMIEHSHFGNSYMLKPTYDPKFDTESTKSFFIQPGDIKPGKKGHYEFITVETLDKDGKPEDLAPVIFSDGTKDNVLSIAQGDAITTKDLPEFFADGKGKEDKKPGEDAPKETSVKMSTPSSAEPEKPEESEEPSEPEASTEESTEVESSEESTTTEPTTTMPLIPLEPAVPITTVTPTPTEKMPEDEEEPTTSKKETTEQETTSEVTTEPTKSETVSETTSETTSESSSEETTSQEPTESETNETTKPAEPTKPTKESSAPSTTKTMQTTESEKPTEGTRPADKDSSSKDNVVVKWFGGLPDIVQLLIYLLTFIGAGAAIGWFSA